jgi:DNA gyrase inhibitor GyrI
MGGSGSRRRFSLANWRPTHRVSQKVTGYRSRASPNYLLYCLVEDLDMVKMVMISGGTVVGMLAFFGWKLTARGAYESAEYTVVEADGKIEIREYPDMMLAATSMRTRSQGNDGSFMRLFRYISGANNQKQKIAMTTPVFMESKTSESQADSDGTMGFVIPKDVARGRVPDPSDGDVQIRKRRGGRFAVIRFAGRMNAASLEKAEKELRSWLSNRGLTAVGSAERAGYDPPWTPGPLRRNEVLLRLKESAE